MSRKRIGDCAEDACVGGDQRVIDPKVAAHERAASVHIGHTVVVNIDMKSASIRPVVLYCGELKRGLMRAHRGYRQPIELTVLL